VRKSHYFRYRRNVNAAPVWVRHAVHVDSPSDCLIGALITTVVIGYDEFWFAFHDCPHVMQNVSYIYIYIYICCGRQENLSSMKLIVSLWFGFCFGLFLPLYCPMLPQENDYFISLVFLIQLKIITATFL
jgi:hypothetical protein